MNKKSYLDWKYIMILIVSFTGGKDIVVRSSPDKMIIADGDLYNCDGNVKQDVLLTCGSDAELKRAPVLA